MDMFMALTAVMVSQVCICLKIIHLYAFNMCSFSYIKHTLIKWIFKNDPKEIVLVKMVLGDVARIIMLSGNRRLWLWGENCFHQWRDSKLRSRMVCVLFCSFWDFSKFPVCLTSGHNDYRTWESPQAQDNDFLPPSGGISVLPHWQSGPNMPVSLLTFSPLFIRQNEELNSGGNLHLLIKQIN